MSKIVRITARPILDSRGEWTVEACVVLGRGAQGVASVPEGKSTGSHEAHVLPAKRAAANINRVISRKFARRDFRSQKTFDDFLIQLDGTPEKSKLGANAMLAASIAFARAFANEKKIPLWKSIRKTYGLPVPESPRITRPRLFMNLINGGMHGGSNLDIQEYVIIPKTRTFAEAIRIGNEIDHELRGLIERTKGKAATNLGDEGGFAPDFKDNAEPLRWITRVVKKLRYGKKIDFGIDAAATNIKKLNEEELWNLYEKLIRTYPLIYLEDPFGEERFEEFGRATRRFGKTTWVAGDDLTTTNIGRMERAHAEKSVNAIIIKPNQIGTVSETLDAVRLARKYGWKVIVSHRSGETDDDFIADFAYGVGADGFKLGAPARGERVAKYNRLLEIEREQ